MKFSNQDSDKSEYINKSKHTNKAGTVKLIAAVILTCIITSLLCRAYYFSKYNIESSKKDSSTESGTESNQANQANKSDQSDQAGAMKIVAHRGYSGLAPENTQESFERAIQAGADMLEMDVQETRDGVLVVFHDLTIKRITGNSGSISDYTYDQLCQMNYGSHIVTKDKTGLSRKLLRKNYSQAKLMTFDEFLQLAADQDIEVNCELKDMSEQDGLSEDAKVNFPTKVAEAVVSYGIQDNFVFASFNYDYLTAIKAYDSSLKTLCNTKIANPDVLLADYDADCYGLDIDTMNTDTIDALHAAGKKVYVYTVNKAYQMVYAKKLGADGICTNYCGLAKVITDDSYTYLSENYRSSFAVPLLYDSVMTEDYGDYIVSGIAKINNDVVISAYDSNGEKNSILYILDLDGTLQDIVDLGFVSKIRSIAYDPDHDYLWCVAPEGKVCALCWTDILEGNYQASEDDIKYAFDPELGDQIFLTYYDSKLYVGNYVETLKSELADDQAKDSASESIWDKVKNFFAKLLGGISRDDKSGDDLSGDDLSGDDQAAETSHGTLLEFNLEDIKISGADSETDESGDEAEGEADAASEDVGSSAAGDTNDTSDTSDTNDTNEANDTGDTNDTNDANDTNDTNTNATSSDASAAVGDEAAEDTAADAEPSAFSTLTSITLNNTYEIPGYIQGITFIKDATSGTTRMLLSQTSDLSSQLSGQLSDPLSDQDESEGSTHDSKLLFYNWSEGSTGKLVCSEKETLPEGLCQISMSSEGLYMIFNSSAKAYRDSVRKVNDRVWLLGI